MTFAASGPYAVNEFELILALTKRVFADRDAIYPALVEDGSMTPEKAADGIKCAGGLVADWQRVVDLRAGREPKPLDATTTTYEKRATAEYIHTRAQLQLREAVTALRSELKGSPALRAIDAGELERPMLQFVFDTKMRDWPHVTLGIFLVAERRTWVTEALLWHAERWPLAMVNAEIQSELIARDAVAQAA